MAPSAFGRKLAVCMGRFYHAPSLAAFEARPYCARHEFALPYGRGSDWGPGRYASGTSMSHTRAVRFVAPRLLLFRGKRALTQLTVFGGPFYLARCVERPLKSYLAGLTAVE